MSWADHFGRSSRSCRIRAARWNGANSTPSGPHGAALVRHHGDAVLDRPVRHLVPAPPFVPGLPGGDGPGAVVSVAERDSAGDPVQYAALGVGGLDDVHGLGPVVERPVDVGDFAGPEEREERAEAEVFGDAGRVAEADGFDALGLLRSPDDDRSARGLDDLDLDGFTARHLDRLDVPGDGPPLPVGVERLPTFRSLGSFRSLRSFRSLGPDASQSFPVQVLVVGHRVGDGPGDRAGVGEVGDARDAGDGEADDVELGAGEVDLLVDAGVLDEAVGVARDDRLPGGGPLARDEPAVAAGGAGTVGGEEVHGLRSDPADDLLPPQLGGETGEEDVRAEPDAERGPGLPAPRGEPGRRELRCAPGAFGQPLVDPVDVRHDPVGGLRIPSLQRREATSRGVVEPGPACEPVPADGLGAEERGGGALRAVPFDLQLPGTVEGGDTALGTGEGAGVGGAQVGDPPRVTVELGGHNPSPHLSG